MGLHAGLSLLSNYGHDIGGFAGPQPDPELLLRWIQCGIYFPRFCIHSWKKEGITEPWMYPAILSHVREAIQFRYSNFFGTFSRLILNRTCTLFIQFGLFFSL